MLELRMFVQSAACHDHCDIAQCLQVFQRIFLGDDQVCALAGFNGTGNVTDTGKMRISECCRIQRETVGYARL